MESFDFFEYMALPNKITAKGLLSSPMDDFWSLPGVQGSYYRTIRQKIEENLNTQGGNWKVLEDVRTGESLTAQACITLGQSFAKCLLDLGLKRGDVVHVVVGNSNLVVPLCFGIWTLGGVASLGDINLEPRSIALQLQDSKSSVVVCKAETFNMVNEAVELVDNRKVQLLCLDKLADTIRDDNMDDCDPPVPVEIKNPDEEAVIIFWSSGTTGHPKGICHSHTSAFRALGYLGQNIPPDRKILATTRFFHVGGFLSILNSLQRRHCHYHMGDHFCLDTIVNVILEKKPCWLYLATHHYILLAESKAFAQLNERDLDSVEVVVPVGAAVPQSCRAIMQTKFKNLKGVMNAYGMTEIGVVMGGLNVSHLGTLYPGASIKIADPVSGRTLGPNEEGEIRAKSHGVLLRFVGDPTAKANLLDDDGFFHTGDLGYYTADAKIIFKERLKEIIKYKGNHVSPTELEDILQRHPAVVESLVFGKPEPTCQELICAVVVPKLGYEVTEDDLLAFVNEQVTDYKRIRGGIIFSRSIPRNSVGKLVRKEMRKWAANEFQLQRYGRRDSSKDM